MSRQDGHHEFQRNATNMLQAPFHPYTSKVKTAKQKTAKKSPRQRKTAKGNNIETSF